MCFDQSWKQAFWMDFMQDWLSQWKHVGPSWGKFRSLSNCRNHKASLVVVIIIIISNSIKDRTIGGCLQLCHELESPPIRNT